MSSGGPIGSQMLGNMASTMLAGINGGGSAGSTTKAAVSEGTITVRNGDKQQQNVNDLSRDVANANPGLDKIFDKEKEQRRVETVQAVVDIGLQVSDIVRTEGKIAGEKAKLDPTALQAAKEALSGKGRLNPTADEIAKQAYDTAMKPFGTGSSLQQGLQAATAAIQGLAGGNIGQAISGAAAPYLAEVIKQTAPDETSRIIAHAVVAGVTAAAQGNSALAGAAGAATTAAMGEAIKNALYGDVPVNQLSEEQKQTLVALGTVAAGLAGGLTGNSMADAVAGAQAGQNEVSNNMVSMGMLQMMQAKSLLDSAAMAEGGKGGANEQAALALTKKVKEGLDAACVANPSCLLMAVVSAQSQQHADGGGWTETLPIHEDQTGSTLVTPIPEENKGTTLVTPDRSEDQGESHTGNTEGTPDTGGNSTLTPIPEQNKDDLAYLAEGRDNRLPIPEPTVASNGLKIESNSKHTPGGQGFRPNAGIEPRDSLDLFEHSIVTKDPKIRLSIDNDGNIHRFFNTSKDGTGTFHWSGSTGDGKNALGNRELGSFNKEIKELKGKK